MEFEADKMLQDKNESGAVNEMANSPYPKVDSKDVVEQVRDTIEVKHADVKSGENIQHSVSGEVNMEASITTDDVIRAGGFGARDDISSFLPVASDLTDFEAAIRDARDYEELQGETSRPGLGWSEATKSE